MPTDAQRNARKNYRAKGKRITVDFCPTELCLVDWLDRQGKKQSYIKELIRKDMESHKDTKPIE